MPATPPYWPYFFKVSQHYCFGRRCRLRFDSAWLQAADTRAISGNCQGCHEEGRSSASRSLTIHGSDPLSRSFTKPYLGCGSRCNNIMHRMPTRAAPIFNEEGLQTCCNMLTRRGSLLPTAPTSTRSCRPKMLQVLLGTT